MKIALAGFDYANKQELIDYLNGLIVQNFPLLVQILYRLDINETKLKLLLKQNTNQEAAAIIADLIIEREQQKELTKKMFASQVTIPEEDKW